MWRIARWGWFVLRFIVQMTFVVVRWPAMMVLLLILSGLQIYLLGAWLAQLEPGSLLQAVVGIGVRLLIALPLAGVGVLLLHPVRGPWMLVSLPRRLVRRLVGHRHTAAHQLPGEELRKPPVLLYRPLSRRRFLVESAAVGAVMVDAFFIEPNAVEFTTVDLPVRDLPQRFRGFTIAQLSDLHMSSYTTPATLEQIIPRVNSLGADMIVITGDFIDHDGRLAAPTVEVLRGLQAPMGVYSVLGNHDYYSGVDAVVAALRRGNMGLLRNSHTVLRHGADKLYLVGSDDATRRIRRADLRQALRGVKHDAPRLLLLHNPILAPAVVAAGLDIALCGHTHAGQFRVPYLTGKLVQRIEYIDWGRYHWGGTEFYVNRGFGTVGPPMRFRARPEITLIRLVAAEEQTA